MHRGCYHWQFFLATAEEKTFTVSKISPKSGSVASLLPRTRHNEGTEMSDCWTLYDYSVPMAPESKVVASLHALHENLPARRGAILYPAVLRSPFNYELLIHRLHPHHHTQWLIKQHHKNAPYAVAVYLFAPELRGEDNEGLT